MQSELTGDEVIELMNFDDQHGFQDRRFAWSNAITLKYLMKCQVKNYTPKPDVYLAEMDRIRWPKIDTPDPDLPDDLRWKKEQDLFR